MGAFGTPVQGRTNDAQAPSAPEPGAEPQELIDSNDPRLTSEDVTMNVEGDAYAQPAPPPDGKYRTKLKLMQVEDAQGGKHDYLPKLTKRPPIVPYLFTAIEARILDPSGKYDNIPVFDRWVGTFMNRDGATKVSTILARLKKPDGTPYVTPGMRLSHKGWMDLFVKALAGEPEIGIETAWEWSCQTCGEEAEKAGKPYPRSVTGMSKFPAEADPAKRKNGQLFQPEMKCQVNPAHGYSRAQVRPARFLHLSELK